VSSPRKGVSNVFQMALVLVAIIVAFYVAQSMLGSVQQNEPPTDEALEFVNLTTSRDAYMNWQISIYVENPGDSTVTLEKVFVNSMEVSEYSAGSPTEIVATITADIAEETNFESGSQNGLTVWIGGRFGFFNSGSVIDIKIVSSVGSEFVKTVILP
jgi:hypothetical protein